MIERVVKIIKYNAAQLLVVLSAAKTTILEWGRGTGKSTVLAERMIKCVHQMPKSTGILYGASYSQIKERTIPSLISSLAEHGYYQDQHFFIGKKAPKNWNWPEAYESPIDPENSMYWYNGTVVIFVSQNSNATSGRGLNGDWLIGDEALTYNGEKFMTDASATIRGGLMKIAEYPDGTWKYFKDCPLHHSITLASSTPISVEGQWFLRYEEEARDPSKSILFIRANALVNKENLGKQFFISQRAVMPDFLFNAEILNIRVNTIKDGFYPKLTKNHEYSTMPEDYNPFYQKKNETCEADTDLDISIPLIIGVDWGANINCLCVAQRHDQELRFINSLFVKSPLILDDLADKFDKYYEPIKSKNNLIKFFYDPTGNTSTANSRYTFATQFVNILSLKGWKVEMLTRGMSNVNHEDKYKLWSELLSETQSKYPKIRFNTHNCRELLISMKNTPAKRGTKVAIQKVKSSEKRKGLAQEHATHFGDSADLIVTGLFLHLYKGFTSMPEAKVQ